MERDFLGLSSKVTVTVKEEATEDSKNSDVQWCFPKNASALPQFLSFSGAEDDRSRKIVLDRLPSSGFLTASTAETFDPCRKLHSGVMQKNGILDISRANHQGMVLPLQHFNAHRVLHAQEARVLPVSNQPTRTFPVVLNSPVLQPQMASAVQDVVGSTFKPLPRGAVQNAAAVSVPPSSSVIGTTDVGDVPKLSGALAQLTIFYAGSVCVFDDVSPEKAQAIMLLAGDGSSQPRNSTVSTDQVQASSHRSSPGDGVRGAQSHAASTLLGLSTPRVITSNSGGSHLGGSGRSDELVIAKPIATSVAPTMQPEPPKAVGSLGSVASSFIPAAVPQARKASLARFLEKRKERINTSPYHVIKKASDCSNTESNSLSLSIE